MKLPRSNRTILFRFHASQRSVVAQNSNIIRAGNIRVDDTVEDSIIVIFVIIIITYSCEHLTDYLPL